jgi:hypothetical protein
MIPAPAAEHVARNGAACCDLIIDVVPNGR